MNRVPHLLLASSSPRRIDFLNQLGLKVSVFPPLVSEDKKPGESPEKMVIRLSREKALYVAKREKFLPKTAQKSRMIIAADTTVVSPNGKVAMGKPVSKKNAQKMLETLSGKTHTVLTAYYLIYEVPGQKPKHISRMVRSKVSLKPLDKQSIRNYIRTGEPMDKAGAYAAQGIGMALVEKISGSYTNVVGLPLSHFLSDFEKLTGLKLLEWAQ